jgi:hypothetical protein
MHDEMFGQVLRGLPRRGFLGLAASLSAIAMRRPSAEARRKKRKKRKKCKEGTAKCGKKCFNLNTDSANCGACGVVCSSGRACSAGVCACPAGQSFVAGACIPRFGCTLDLDTCEVGKNACPDFPIPTANLCFVTAEGEPFCGTSSGCAPLGSNATCPPEEGQAQILVPCAACTESGLTGACVKPTVQGPA